MNSPDSLVHFISDPALALNGDLQVVAWNKAMQALTGYSYCEVSNRTCYDVLQAIHPGGQPLCTPSCEGGDCFRRGKLFSVPCCKIRDRDGQFHTVSYSSMVVPPEVRKATEDRAIAIIFLHQNEADVNNSALHSLQVFSFGHFGLVAQGKGLEIEKWKRKQALKLLKYLITHRGHAIPRERLVECLWPDVDEHHGRDRLKVTLYYLRNQLRKAGISDEIIETINHTYLLRADKIWLDADIFELTISEGSFLTERKNWKEAIRSFDQVQHLYRGEYLEEEIYEDWCAEERERLRELYLDMLAKMAQCYAELNLFSKAVQVCRRALACEACREYFHRALMIHLTQAGQRDQAISHYKNCQKILLQELGVEPMVETKAIYKQIVECKISEKMDI